MRWGKLAVCAAAFLLSEICRLFIDSYREYVFGVGSSFMYDSNPWMARCVRWGCVGVCSALLPWGAVVNPLFITSLAMDSNDVLFTGLYALGGTVHPTFGYMVAALVKHTVIEPQPSVSALWLLDTHFYTDFRFAARITVVILEILAIFLSRHFDRKSEIGFLLVCLFDPCLDWTVLAWFSSKILIWANGGTIANAGILIALMGFVFNQAAVYAWWNLRIGNANFAMIGSLLYSIGLITLIYHHTTLTAKKKCE